MQHGNLWAPWRIGYLRGEDRPPQRGGDGNRCFLCDAAEPELDEAAKRERLVLVRDERGVLLMNRYPYTNGHLLAAPHDHVGDLSALSPEARCGLMELMDLGTRLLDEAMEPQGVNVGINIGRAAGAGEPGHLHAHVVPRWHGDVNFMESIAGVRVIPEALERSYTLLLEAASNRTRRRGDVQEERLEATGEGLQ